MVARERAGVSIRRLPGTHQRAQARVDGADVLAAGALAR